MARLTMSELPIKARSVESGLSLLFDSLWTGRLTIYDSPVPITRCEAGILENVGRILFVQEKIAPILLHVLSEGRRVMEALGRPRMESQALTR